MNDEKLREEIFSEVTFSNQVRELIDNEIINEIVDRIESIITTYKQSEGKQSHTEVEFLREEIFKFLKSFNIAGINRPDTDENCFLMNGIMSLITTYKQSEGKQSHTEVEFFREIDEVFYHNKHLFVGGQERRDFKCLLLRVLGPVMRDMMKYFNKESEPYVGVNDKGENTVFFPSESEPKVEPVIRGNFEDSCPHCKKAIYVLPKRLEPIEVEIVENPIVGARTILYKIVCVGNFNIDFLDKFYLKQEAIDFCHKHGLKIINETGEDK